MIQFIFYWKIFMYGFRTPWPTHIAFFWPSALLWNEGSCGSLSGSVQSVFALQDLASEVQTNTCTSWHMSGNYGLYVPKRILKSSMNVCGSYLGLGKSLIIDLNSVWVQDLTSIVVCLPGSWAVWVLRGNWHFGISRELLGTCRGSGQGEDVRGGAEGEQSEG